jgi:adenylate kinase family enzyme
MASISRVPETDRVGDARRILVYGVTGSGKSTLATTLGEIVGIPATDVDRLCWRPGWVQVPKDEQRAVVDELTRTDAWILDAAYLSWSDVVLRRAELVVTLDYSRWRSLTRLLRRTLLGIVTRRELCNGNHDSWGSLVGHRSIVAWHTRSFRSQRERMRGWAAAVSGPRVVLLRRPSEADAFLERVREEAAGTGRVSP